MSCYVVAQKILDQRMGGMKKIAWGSNADAGRGVAHRHTSSLPASRRVQLRADNRVIHSISSHLCSRLPISVTTVRSHASACRSKLQSLTRPSKRTDTAIQRGVASSRSLSAVVDMMHRKRGSNMVKAERNLGEAVQHVSSLWWHPRAAVTPPLTPCVTRRHCQRIALSALR